VQLAVQMIFFLHIGNEVKPRYNLIAFSSAMVVVFIVVFGSLWIMNNLNYHHGGHLSGEDANSYIQQDEIINKDSLR
jgi:cytochrome o ubiquinol oxidase operon protein cyoD